MTITKLGHCCMVLEVNGVRLMTDPGDFATEAYLKQTGLDGVLITHEHSDHFHADSVQHILANNPGAVVVANESVGKLLADKGIAYTKVGDGDSTDINGIQVEGFGKDHALVYPPGIGLVENTGYFVANTFYFPGDNFHAPGKPVDVLALPVAGPWMKIAEAIDFAKAVKPRIAFGVHDGMLIPSFRGFIHRALRMCATDTEFVEFKDGETKEF